MLSIMESVKRGALDITDEVKKSLCVYQLIKEILLNLNLNSLKWQGPRVT